MEFKKKIHRLQSPVHNSKQASAAFLLFMGPRAHTPWTNTINPRKIQYWARYRRRPKIIVSLEAYPNENT